jgi:hypothetical protein
MSVDSDIGPFAIVPEWVLRRVSPQALALFAELALHADRKTAKAWPSRARLAERLNVTTKTIDRSMKELVDIDAIEKHHRRDDSGWHSSLYLVKYVSPPSVVSTPTPSPVDVPQNQKHFEPEPRTRALLPRKRDEIADALARFGDGADPNDVPAGRMRTLCVKAAELRRLMPSVTAEEVERRAANWPGLFAHATLTGPALVEHWGSLAMTRRPHGIYDDMLALADGMEQS